MDILVYSLVLALGIKKKKGREKDEPVDRRSLKV
jgi:hypothetical protein